MLDQKHKAGLAAAQQAFKRKQAQKMGPNQELQKRLTFMAPTLMQFQNKPGFETTWDSNKHTSHLTKI